MNILHNYDQFLKEETFYVWLYQYNLTYIASYNPILLTLVLGGRTIPAAIVKDHLIPPVSAPNPSTWPAHVYSAVFLPYNSFLHPLS